MYGSQDDICELFPSVRFAPVLQVKWLSLGEYYSWHDMSVCVHTCPSECVNCM